jgi:hypothetical protein
LLDEIVLQPILPARQPAAHKWTCVAYGHIGSNRTSSGTRPSVAQPVGLLGRTEPNRVDIAGMAVRFGGAEAANAHLNLKNHNSPLYQPNDARFSSHAIVLTKFEWRTNNHHLHAVHSRRTPLLMSLSSFRKAESKRPQFQEVCDKKKKRIRKIANGIAHPLR